MKCKNYPQLQLKGERTPLFLFGIGVFLLLIQTANAGGFASSYVKSVNGENYFEIPLEEERSYFIYPQNQDNEDFIIKIELTDEYGLLINPLEEQYTVPANTLSDGFPIELRLRLPDNATNETEYALKYSVLTSTIADGSNTVEFSPVGFIKDFIVTAKQVEEIEDDTPNTTTPPTNDDDDGSNNGGGSGSSGGEGTSDGLQDAIEDLNKTNNTEQNVDFEETTEILPTVTEENVIDDSSSNKLLMLSVIGGLLVVMVVGTTIIWKSDKD